MHLKRSITILLFLVSSHFTLNVFAQQNQFANQLRLAKTFEARGQLEEAEAIYAQIYSKQPQNYQFYHSFYKILINQKKYAESQELVENQIKISKSKVTLYGDLGAVYYLQGKENEAMQIWEDALNLEPENPFAYRTIANYLIEHRLLESAIEVLHRGNEVSDDKTIFSYDIANFYSITMKFEEATREYCSILLNKPKQLNLIKNRIIGYINSNQATEPTLSVVEEIYEEEENIVFLKLLSELYSRTNNSNKALETVINIEEQTTRNGSAIFAFAQQSSRNGNYRIASDAYSQIIKNYPNSALFSESEIGYTRSLEAELRSNSSRISDWKPFTLNDSINKLDYQNLISGYNKLVIKYPDNRVGWEAEYRIASIYLDYLNEPEIADSLFNKILDEVKTIQYIEEAKYGLAQLSIFRGDLNEAERLLNQITHSRRSENELKLQAAYLLAKTYMWQGEFSKSVRTFKLVMGDAKEKIVNDALEYSLILNTFKSDSSNLFSFTNADYLVEKKNFNDALLKFEGLAKNKDLFLLKDFAALRYAELLLALNNYKEAGIFLEEISNCDEDNIYKDRFLYLLGSNYYYGMNNPDKAVDPLSRIFNEFPNSIYFSKAVKIISEINARVGSTL